MEQALALARQALGLVSPNPAVGAVLVRDGRIVGQGHTQPPDGAHAEVVALREAGEQARGATLYVTLEPCAHHGRTPPCTSAIIEAGVAQVRIAAMDPNPATGGRGLAALESAGLPVTVSPESSDEARSARQVIEGFARHVTTGLPFVTAKFAMSLDGKIATHTGSSRWISSQESRQEAHRLRAWSDAVLVGVGTAIADNPRLTVRDVPELTDRHPLRVVADSRGRTPPDAAMFREPGDTLVAVANAPQENVLALQGAGAEVVSLPDRNGRVDLTALLALLGQRGVTSVLVESGDEFMGAMVDLGLVDRYVCFVAPIVIGGRDAPPPVAGLGVPNVDEALRLRDVSYRQVGPDMMVSGYVEKG